MEIIPRINALTRVTEMAKKFKDYDKLYAEFAGTAIKSIEKIGGKIAREDFAEMTYWPYINRFTENYSSSDIATAVYTSARAEEWQKFRVSMKGLSTNKKLYALAWYWDTHVEVLLDRAPFLPQPLIDEITRVNNYLGALKRGGQLNNQLQVLK